jgi:hypothetical protein
MLPVLKKRSNFPYYRDDFFTKDLISSFFSDGADYSVPAVNIKENENHFEKLPLVTLSFARVTYPGKLWKAGYRPSNPVKNNEPNHKPLSSSDELTSAHISRPLDACNQIRLASRSFIDGLIV